MSAYFTVRKGGGVGGGGRSYEFLMSVCQFNPLTVKSSEIPVQSFFLFWGGGGGGNWSRFDFANQNSSFGESCPM